MKLFKLVKTIDYVNYPSYKELVKISEAITDSVISVKNLLISAVIGILFDKTPLSKWLLEYLAETYSDTAWVVKVATFEDASVVLAILIAIAVYLLIRLKHFIAARWGSNKNTKEKRDLLVLEFYHMAIPQLIEVKSILEQIEEKTSIQIGEATAEVSDDNRKKLLLLLQAKYDICDLNNRLRNMDIINKRSNGLASQASAILQDRIGRCAYLTFLEEMLDCLLAIYEGLLECGSETAGDDIEDIRAIINSTGVFNLIKELEIKYETIKKIVNPATTRSAYSDAK